MKLYITRHGETEYNVKRLLTGQTKEVGLTDKGKKQAESLAKRLFKEKIDMAYSSTLDRSKETIEPLVKKRAIVAISTPLLMERSFGEWEGKSIDDYWPWVEEQGASRTDPYFKPLGGESFSEVKVRTGELLRLIEGRYENVLLNSHGGTTMALFSNLLGDVSDGYRVKNCSLSIVDWNNGSSKIELFNDISHL